MASLRAVLGDARPCYICGAPGSRLCRPCQRDAAVPPIDERIPGIARVIAPWAYDGAPRSLILDLKLRAQHGAAEPLIARMVDEVRAEGTRADAITWVPGRRGDNARRGFDHAAVLANGIARATGISSRALLHRVGTQVDQTALGRTARLANLHHAFRATSCSGTILLVDDLVTTGATARSCATALKKAGARRVELLVACRA